MESDEGSPDAEVPALAPMQGTVAQLLVTAGAEVHEGQPLLVMEAMKMEHVVAAPCSGLVSRFAVAEGETVLEGRPLAFLEPRVVERAHLGDNATVDLDHVRPDLAAVV